MAASKTIASIRVIAALLVTAAFAFPLYWLFITAFKTVPELKSAVPTFWPETFAWENFKRIFQVAPMHIYTYNTVVMTVVNIFLQINISIITAYAFAKGQFPGKEKLFLVVIAALIVPEQIIFVPTYVMLSKLGWLNTFLALTIPHAASAYSIFLMRQVFKSINNDVIDAAKVDGANKFHIMYRILVPMAKSTVVTLVILKFIGNWNAYFWPLVMTNSEKMRVITVAVAVLKNVANEEAVNYHIVMAGSLIAIAPIIVLFIIAQKHIITAMAHSTFK
ncbi:carbohydrate ABC transporter permease [Paenibacillus allorhizosphaerae]|uniref:Lactose transport system permease protein LacG n=1 Tax=Paenibacillus allorhizosphaerae TaxID=2849866 RepID=A0ABM8VQU0_9BACL|nr:carbohydrate ABC transporter permease [Paenibacillus allorhizosphaerae]CAG7654644.1 Lactose transport system permease protein LacG [Paenibacillus allorhizosphaerae]